MSATLAGNGGTALTVRCPYCAFTVHIPVLVVGNVHAVAQTLGADFAAHVAADHPELLLPVPEGRPS